MTTIKVPKPLRQRIAGAAAGEGLSAAAFVERLVDRYERDRRLSAVGQAYREGADQEYVADTAAWETAAGPITSC
jgi:hypothetical protein